MDREVCDDEAMFGELESSGAALEVRRSFLSHANIVGMSDGPAVASVDTGDLLVVFLEERPAVRMLVFLGNLANGRSQEPRVR